MSILNKLGAVALGSATATGWVATKTVQAIFQAAAEKLGNGSYTSSSGATYTGSDYRNIADKCESSIFKQGFEKSKKLWQDKD